MNSASVVRSYLESFASGDPKVIAAHVSEDFKNIQVAALGTGCETRAKYQERLREFLLVMVGLVYESENIVQEDDLVMVAYRMRATWRGVAPIDLRGVQSLVVRDGLIVERTDYWDAVTFLLQSQPSAAEALRSFGV